MDLTISIAHLGGWEMLADCLQSLQDSLQGVEVEVRVVDNASGDATKLEAQFPWVQVVRLSGKQGFTANHNRGLRGAHGRYVAILNNDTLLHPGVVDRLVAFLDAHPQVGIVGPMIFNPDGTPQPCCGPFVTLRSELAGNLLPSRWVHRSGAHSFPFSDPSVCWPDWVGGVCLVTRRELWEQLGGLDEGFYIFFEETDFCRRVRAQGGQIAHVLPAQLVHLGGQNTGEGWMDETQFVHYCRSQIRYFRKHHRGWERLILRTLSALAFGGKAVLWGLRGALPRRRSQAVSQARTFARVGLMMAGLDRHREEPA